MDFVKLYSEVQSIVKRPDMQARIESAIRTATLKLHHTNFYYKDQVETGVSFPTPDFVLNFDPKIIFPQFRKISYIRRWNYDPLDVNNLGCPGNLLKPVELGNIVDAYGYDKTESYYMAGNLIQIRGSRALSHALVGAFVHPVVATPETYKSWIADEYPYAIVHEAARAIFAQIGFQEQAKNMSDELGLTMHTLTLNAEAMPGE